PLTSALSLHAALPIWAAPAALPPVAVPSKTATDILLVHRPGSAQSNIVAGNTTIPPTDPGYYAGRVATQVLGGGADARLFLILRSEEHTCELQSPDHL